MKQILWHKIDPCDEHPEGKDWHQVELHATDAQHALRVDPDHWATSKPDEMPADAEQMTDEDHDGDAA